MHRIINIAGNDDNNIDLIEQPSADCIFITSVKSDLNLLSELIDNQDIGKTRNNLRAIHSSCLQTPAQVDNYINKTISFSKIVVVRIFGDKGSWSYGLEQLDIWNKKNKNSKLIVLSGTDEEDISLNELSNIDFNISLKLSFLLRAGGNSNFLKFLKCLDFLLKDNFNFPNNYLTPKIYPEPYFYDWKNEEGIPIGIISYKSLFLSNELDLSKKLNLELRNNGFAPKTFFVTTLKNINTQKELINIVKKQNIKLLITSTSFDSTIKDLKYQNKEFQNLFEILNIPVIQILTSNRNKNEWLQSSIGMNSLDLLMQIIMPEFDGRITSLPCSFKEVSLVNKSLCTEISKYKYDEFGIKWLIKFIKNYIKLSEIKNENKKICLIISNYPVKNGRIGNGVGLNTPESIVNILKCLKGEGYNTGDSNLPRNSSDLMSMILKSRTNDPESQNNKPLNYLSLEAYLKYWDDLPYRSKEKIIKRWDIPQNSIELEKEGFSINGIIFGNICVLIQPQRGYCIDTKKDIHSPDLPPPHRYLAQYHWVEYFFKANAICHIGKHGTVEWLPGKSVGLSKECFPNIIFPPIPNIYPFIVNDPGEGSQAKRRTHSIIIDHLTPPLDRSEMYGYLYKLENLVDEYYEAKLLNSGRIKILFSSIQNIVKKEFNHIFDENDNCLVEKLDSYLCEIKESQIRVGLHTFGLRNKTLNEINLVLSICRAPTQKRQGITQFIASSLNLSLETWISSYDQILSDKDQIILNALSNKKITNFRRAIEFIEDQAKFLIYYYFYKNNIYIDEIEKLKSQILLNKLIIDSNTKSYFNLINDQIIAPIILSANNEMNSFISALKSNFIKSGPSGAPTRGKLEVLPTGKNFYSVDTRSLPTESAWIVGNESANQILDLYKLDHGENLRSLAISVWATSTMRNGGEDICQILSLMGIKPIWDGPSRRVIDIEAIPINVLSRPRVDVTIRISGMFRDAFPQLILLLSKAVKLVSKLNEKTEDNPLLNCINNNQSIYRIFGSAPGSYGAGLQELISNGSWNNNDDFADAYINWSKWIYDGFSEPKSGKQELIRTLKNVQIVIQNQDNKEHDILDSDDYYQFQGGLSTAIKKISGSYPDLYHGDLSKFKKSKVSKLSKEIDKVVRSRILNPKWIEGMMGNGYKGAFEFSASLDYLYAYDATTNVVSNWCYESIYKSWLCDKELEQFFLDNNPWAIRDIAQRFLELINRRMWENNEKEVIDNLKSIINNTEAKIEKSNF